MNKNNIEVELKYRIGDEEFLVRWLKTNAKLKYTKRQVDDYYTLAHRNFFDKKFPDEYLRIRKSGDKYSIAYKFWYSTGVEGEYSHCDEYETGVENGNQLKKIFEALNFRLLLTIDKTRHSYEYKNFEIEIDEVKELGTICEIEIKGDIESIDAALSQIRNFAKSIGLKEESRDQDLKLGYVYMLARKKGML